jgi:hypothetical protein
MTPVVAQRVEKPCTAFQGGKSAGNARHVVPLSVK